MARKTKESQIQELKKQLEEYRGYVDSLCARNNELINAEENTFLNSPSYLQMKEQIKFLKNINELHEITIASLKKREIKDFENYRQVFLDNKKLTEEKADSEYFIGIAQNWRDANEYQKLKNENYRLQGKIEQLNITDQNKTDQINQYILRIAELTKELEKQSSTIEPHNARGAGRKPMDTKMQQQLNSFQELIEAGATREQIMASLHIGKATYYRYKQHVKNINN